MRKKCRWLMCLLPVLLVILLILQYGVNVLWWDEWELVKYLREGLSFDYFISFHNEHRLLFPKLILVFCNWISGWNTKVQMLVSAGLVSGIYYLCAYYIYAIKKEHTWKTVIQILIIGFLIFSPVQYFNFLMGFQIGFNLVCFAAVFAFYSIYRFYETKKLNYYILAGVGACVAAFSSLHGLIVWIVLLLGSTGIYILGKRERKFLKYLAGQYGMAAVTFLAYFIHYTKPIGHPGIGEGGILGIVRSFFIVLGGVCGNKREALNIAAGVAIFTLSIGVSIRSICKKEIQKNIFGLSLNLFGLGCAAAAALGRVGFGVQTVLSFTDRYSTFSILAILGIGMIAINKSRREALFVFWLELATAAIGFLFLPDWAESQKDREFVQYVVKNYRECSINELQHVYLWSEYGDAYSMIYELESRKLNVFKEENIREVNDFSWLEGAEQIALPEGTFLGFDSTSISWDERFLWLNNPWAVDFVNGDTYEKVFVKINDVLYPVHRNWMPRQNVADFFQNNKFKNSGFLFSFPIYRLQQGRNQISFLTFLKGGLQYYESQTIELFIEGNTLTLGM